MRGMVVSCPTWGPIWGSPLMAESLAEMRQLGVEWIAIHPYAGVRRDGRVRVTPAASTGFLERAVELSREAGMKLFWKPHLAYWGSFEWRGEIAFGDDAASWRRFFDGYREFIVDQAAFAERAGAELFAVGVETEATTFNEAEWRRIVAAVRQVYSGRITYAANWDTLGKVGFWDAVDVIGVHAYYPLAEDDSPDAETLRRGWDGPLADLRRLAGGLRRDRLQPLARRRPAALGVRDARQPREPRPAAAAHRGGPDPARGRAAGRGHLLVEVDSRRHPVRPRLLDA